MHTVGISRHEGSHTASARVLRSMNGVPGRFVKHYWVREPESTRPHRTRFAEARLLTP